MLTRGHYVLAEIAYGAFVEKAVVPEVFSSKDFLSFAHLSPKLKDAWAMAATAVLNYSQKETRDGE